MSSRYQWSKSRDGRDLLVVEEGGRGLLVVEEGGRVRALVVPPVIGDGLWRWRVMDSADEFRVVWAGEAVSLELAKRFAEECLDEQ